jgi:hypothetical protein
MNATATKVASIFLVPTELLEDAQDFNEELRKTMTRDMHRRLNGVMFGESYYDLSTEVDRLEGSARGGWDSRYYPEDWCDD